MRRLLCVMGMAACGLCACLPPALVALADESAVGLFTEDKLVVAPQPGTGRERGTIRSRIVQVDTKQIIAARRGRGTLRLNLFDDIVYEVRVEQVRPTRSGHYLSGRPVDGGWGEVSLVMNGPIVVGEVTTREGTYTIRPGRSGRHLIRQIDPSPSLPDDYRKIAPPDNTSHASSQERTLEHMLRDRQAQLVMDDGTQIDVLVVYTPAARNAQGGTAGIDALIDLWVGVANEALENSDAIPRINLVHTALTNYVEGNITELRAHTHRLSHPDDGYMDEVHELRNEHAADLVSVIVFSNDANGYGNGRIGGSFSTIATLALSTSLVHELGHNMGLRHDRYRALEYRGAAEIAGGEFGYVNQVQFEPGASSSARWRTIMARDPQCEDSGWECPRLKRFSNPDQRHKGDRLGVPVSDSSKGVDGPANAVLTIDENRQTSASRRTRSCTSFTVSSSNFLVSENGGDVTLDVEAEGNCVWEVNNQSGFFDVLTNRYNHGADRVHIVVGSNTGGPDRTGTLTVAGQTVTIRQTPTDHSGVCSRSLAVSTAITAAAGLGDQAKCAQVTNTHLSKIKSLDLSESYVSTLKGGDFAGLANLEELLLQGNSLSTLPSGVFDGLSKLKTLYLQDNDLSTLPLGVFDDLSKLTTLGLRGKGNGLSTLPSGVFSSLSKLRSLDLSDNGLSSLPSGVFSNLSQLQSLHLHNNSLTTLPSGVFSNLSQLQSLHLYNNSLTTLPSGVFSNLTKLQFLNLSKNGLSTLPSGVFSGQTSLSLLFLAGNSLSTLPSGVFSGVSALRLVSLEGNPGAPFALPVSLAAAGRAQFKAVIPTGAPFEIVLPVSVANGSINGGASTITIPAGKVESDAILAVTPRAGTTDPVTVDIRDLPVMLGLISAGYTLVKSDDLPLVLEFNLPSAPANLRAVPGNARVTLNWDAPDSTSGITGHEYRYKTDGDYPERWAAIPTSAPGEVHASGYIVLNLTNGVNYAFQVRTRNGHGLSGESNEAIALAGNFGRGN